MRRRWSASEGEGMVPTVGDGVGINRAEGAVVGLILRGNLKNFRDEGRE